jgi:D-arabinose 1-dehydrogenase-like Zn-dependent alcohol dehydrogenase
MSKMRVVQVDHPNGPLQLMEREIPEPDAGSVRIRVEACGICHSDSYTKEGTHDRPLVSRAVAADKGRTDG